MRLDMLESKSNGDCVGVELGVGVEVVWIGVAWIDWEVSIGGVAAMDYGFDTKWDFELGMCTTMAKS